MINDKLKVFVAVISHKRAHNVKKITEIVGLCTFFVNKGEGADYFKAGAINVIECGTNICEARNTAIAMAHGFNMPSIQVSDDLKSLKRVKFGDKEERLVYPVEFEHVVKTMVDELTAKNYFYGGVAVTTNRLNYTGEDFSYDKLIVCDLVCVMPGKYKFDENMALKEDYDMTIQQLIEVGGVVRCNQFLCDFPHRDNDGGANTYRNSASEDEATKKLHEKWGDLIKKHPTREGQIALNYNKIRTYDKNAQTLF